MNVSERRTEAKKVEDVFLTIIQKPLQLQTNKKQQRGHPQDPGNLYPLQKPSKTQNCKNHVSKYVFGKFFD